MLSIVSFILPFILAHTFGKTELFWYTGFERFSWLFFLFIPFSISSIAFGFVMKNKKVIKNIIIGFVALTFSLIVPINHFTHDKMDYSNKPLDNISSVTNIAFPSNKRIETLLNGSVNEIYCQFENKTEINNFVKGLSKGNKWVKYQMPTIKETVPERYISFSDDFDYFSLYVVQNDSFNPSSIVSGEYDVVYLAFKQQDSFLFAVDGLKYIK